MNKLSFGNGNAKLAKGIFTFSLPSGYTCPGAKNCLSRAHRKTGKISDGAQTEIRCFSASQEALFPNVRDSRWRNFELVNSALRKGGVAKASKLILAALPKKAKIVRVHVGGDFFSQAYFDTWMEVARQRPLVLFYAYTKSLEFWIAADNKDGIPDNFKLTASYGGKFDAKITAQGFNSAVVVGSQLEAQKLALEIDHDDSHAYGATGPFALLLHNTQPKGSKAAADWQRIKKTVGGYTREKNRGVSA